HISRHRDLFYFFFFQAEDGIRDKLVTGVQTCALPIFDQQGVPPHARRGSVGRVLGLAAGERPAGQRRRHHGLLPERRSLSPPQRSEERRVGKECRSRKWPTA